MVKGEWKKRKVAGSIPLLTKLIFVNKKKLKGKIETSIKIDRKKVNEKVGAGE